MQDTVEEAHRGLDEQHDREESLRSELSALKGELQIMRLDSYGPATLPGLHLGTSPAAHMSGTCISSTCFSNVSVLHHMSLAGCAAVATVSALTCVAAQIIWELLAMKSALDGHL